MIELEDLWNDLAAIRVFSLFCAYPAGRFDAGTAATLTTVGARHTRVVPTEPSDALAWMTADSPRMVPPATSAEVARASRFP